METLDLQKIIYQLDFTEHISEKKSFLHGIDARAKVLITLIFLITMLSVPLSRINSLILFFLYPIITSSLAGIKFITIIRRSLIVLPFVLLIGIFNPLIDRGVAFYIGNVAITEGWISFFSIIIRGMLSVQAVLILIESTGFHTFCRSLQKIGIPSIITTQLLFVYRYLFVLLQEALNMKRARDSRDFGRKSYPIKFWGMFVGQLLIRTIERSERIHNAMISRGFNGEIKNNYVFHWKMKDTIFLLVGTIIILFIRFKYIFPTGNFVSTISIFYQYIFPTGKWNFCLF